MKLGDRRKKKERGSPLRGRATPAYPARLRSERARTLKALLFVFAAPQEFVALDRRHYANRALVPRFRALDASEATHPDRPGKRDFIRQGQQNFNRRAFLYILGQEKVDSAGADVPHFPACFSHCSPTLPADGKRKAHLKALRGAAFGPGQRETS